MTHRVSIKKTDVPTLSTGLCPICGEPLQERGERLECHSDAVSDEFIERSVKAYMALIDASPTEPSWREEQ